MTRTSTAPVISLDDFRVRCPSCNARMEPMHRSARARTKSWRCDPCREFRVVGLGDPIPVPSLWPGLVLLACTAAVVLAVIVFTR